MAARHRLLGHEMTQLGACRTFERMESIVGTMLAVCGGVEGLANEIVAMLRQLPVTSSARRRLHTAILNALVVMEKHRHAQATRSDRHTSEDESDLGKLTDDELLDAACQPLRSLNSAGVLGNALRYLVRRGELEPSILMGGGQLRP